LRSRVDDVIWLFRLDGGWWEWINRRRLLRAAERLTDEQRTKLFDKLTSADPNGDIAAAWFTKELLRDVLACTGRGGLPYGIRDALYRFYAFCAACRAPEIHQLAETIEAWQAPMILAIETGLSNARSEGYNRIVSATRGRAYEWTRGGRSTMSIA
jgi:transposase